MVRASLVLVFIAITQASTFSADWGKTVNELRMSIAIVPNDYGNQELVITVENVGPKDVYLWFGTMDMHFPEKIGVLVTLPDGSRKWAFYAGSGGGIAHGRMFVPRVLPMYPKSSYTLRTLLEGWAYHSPELRRVVGLLSQKASLRAELQTTGVSVPGRDCFPIQIHWSGKLVSNTIQFPLHVK